MVKQPIEPAVKEAQAAVRHAKDVRAYHARKTRRGSPQREADLKNAVGRIKRAMVPLRSFLGSAPYRTQTTTHLDLVFRVKETSKDLQSERRKLWKMQKRKKKRL